MTQKIITSAKTRQACIKAPEFINPRKDSPLFHHSDGLSMPPAFLWPAGLREPIMTAPTSYQFATAVASVLSLCVYAPRLRMKYCYDLVPHAALLQALFMAEQSGNKTKIAGVIKMLMDKIFKRDKDELWAEQDYDEVCQRHPDNKPTRPRITKIKLSPVVSRTELLKRVNDIDRKYGDTLTHLMYTDEIALAIDSNKREFGNNRVVFRQGYDYGSTTDQDYATSLSADVDFRVVIIFFGTPETMKRYMTRAEIEAGSMTRTIVVHVPDEDDAPMFRLLTPAEQKSVDNVLDTLLGKTYVKVQTEQGEEEHLAEEEYIDLSWLDHDVRKWCDQRKEEFSKTGSRALRVCYRRSSVSAFRFTGLVAYLYQLDENRPANWQKLCRQIYNYMANYILDTMLAEYGATYEAIKAEAENDKNTIQPSLFDSCPDEFSYDFIDQLVAERGGTKRTTEFLSTWKKKGWITMRIEDEVKMFTKTEKGKVVRGARNKKGGAA
ncbi:MAG: hypothetical protein J5545_05890 [Bacteroidaceae bacterium]|nr:hypothetical protein [Bacteroidaceae bacterium]